MGNLWVQETYLTVDKVGEEERLSIYSESDVYETGFENPGELYRAMQQENGVCVSKVYVDGRSDSIGWVFRKRTKYEDSPDTFLRETWVTVHLAPPNKYVEYNYA